MNETMKVYNHRVYTKEKGGNNMPTKMFQFFKKQRGITGLETAIILIAFVVVAAVFAYTVLSAGLFSTQKSQEAIYSGLEQAQSTLEIKGGVIAKAENTGADGYISQITFTIANALGGEPVNFTEPQQSVSNNGLADSSTSDNVVVISYIDQDQRVDDLYWTVTKLGSANANNLLESNEKFQITIGSDTAGSNGGNLVDALEPNLTISKSFTIELKSPVGAVLTFQRTTPPYIDQVMHLN